jgi:hypothetical protein
MIWIRPLPVVTIAPIPGATLAEASGAPLVACPRPRLLDRAIVPANGRAIVDVRVIAESITSSSVSLLIFVLGIPI